MTLFAQSKSDTAKAHEFYELAPRINADLVQGDSCRVRLKREQQNRDFAEAMQRKSEETTRLVLASSQKTISGLEEKFRRANLERWVWRSLVVGVLTTIVLKPP